VLVLRVLGIAAAIGLAVLVLLYLLSRDKRYLRYAWRLFQATLGIVLLILVLLFGERILGAL
jgi:cell division protein FtsW (lipid II flippase)